MYVMLSSERTSICVMFMLGSVSGEVRPSCRRNLYNLKYGTGDVMWGLYPRVVGPVL